MITHAFTCTGPYAVLIMLGIKRVENRGSRPAAEKGRYAVSCSKSFCAAEYGNFLQWASQGLPAEDFERVPAWADVKDWPGRIVGTCECAARPESAPYGGVPREAWDEGLAYWWELSEVACFDRPIPCRGNLGMWQMPPVLAAQVNAADVVARCVGEKVDNAEDAARVFRAAMPLAGANEGLFVLPLDDEGRALAEPQLVSLGDPTTTAVRPGDVFGVAFKNEAASVILAHNHPSGDPTPSVQDRQLTATLRAFGGQLCVRVLDHLVIGTGEQGCFMSVKG